MNFDLTDFCRWSSPRRKTWWTCHRPKRWCCMTMWRSNLTRWVDGGRGGWISDGPKDWNISITLIKIKEIHGCLFVANTHIYIYIYTHIYKCIGLFDFYWISEQNTKGVRWLCFLLLVPHLLCWKQQVRVISPPRVFCLVECRVGMCTSVRFIY